MEIPYDKIVQAMPSKPVLISREMNSKSAVLVPFVEIANIEYVLFEKRAKGIRQQGEICFPGGKVDENLDKTTAETAVRETMEELGIPKDKITPGKHLGYLVSSAGLAIDVYIGKLSIKSFSELSPNPGEVENIYHIPFSFFTGSKPDRYMLETEVKPMLYDEKGNREVLFPAKELGLPEIYHAPWKGRSTDIYLYRYEDITIWGITAAIIYEISEIINNGGIV
ncbi:MAG: CoA pyrophosphatase [Spirochaetia bacterium]|jgi:8-oxo-dGTP pyrophosphatase MutT (NUDIX family)|nr:CoA pyrophosphatase [Spirochaetia bacterium]